MKWMLSLLFTLAIWGSGTYAFFYIKDEVPKSLPASSDIVANAEETNEGEGTSKELKEVIHNTQKLVVKIELENGSLGSGFLYNNRGDVVTNAHVVANAKNLRVKTSDSREFSGTVIGVSKDTDIAVVRVPGLEGTTPLDISTGQKAEIGDEVLAFGSPLGLQNTVTTGIISSIDRDFDIEPFHYEDLYQISAPIAPGNSGGPLVDSNTGKVIGINSAGMDQGSIGFSIPIISVLPVLQGWSDSPMTDIPEVALDTDNYEYEEEYSTEDLASYLVNYFYESLNYGDYVTAYSLLGSSWQSNLSYEEFREGYLNTKSVQIDDLAVSKTDETYSCIAVISAEERKDSSNVYSKYKVTYEIQYENDQLKLISGNGEKVE